MGDDKPKFRVVQGGGDGVNVNRASEAAAIFAIENGDPGAFKSAMDSLVGDGFPYDDARRKVILDRCEQIEDPRLRNLVLMDDADLDMQALTAAKCGDQEMRDYFLQVAECTILWWKGFYCREIVSEKIDKIRCLLDEHPIPDVERETIHATIEKAMVNCDWELIADLFTVMEWVEKTGVGKRNGITPAGATTENNGVRVFVGDNLSLLIQTLSELQSIPDAEARRGSMLLLREVNQKRALQKMSVEALFRGDYETVKKIDAELDPCRHLSVVSR